MSTPPYPRLTRLRFEKGHPSPMSTASYSFACFFISIYLLAATTSQGQSWGGLLEIPRQLITNAASRNEHLRLVNIQLGCLSSVTILAQTSQLRYVLSDKHSEKYSSPAKLSFNHKFGIGFENRLSMLLDQLFDILGVRWSPKWQQKRQRKLAPKKVGPEEAVLNPDWAGSQDVGKVEDKLPPWGSEV